VASFFEKVVFLGIKELYRYSNICLSTNTKELVIVDLVMQYPCTQMHMADSKSSVFECKTDENGDNPYLDTYMTELRRILEGELGSKLCPEMCPSTVSLNYMESIKCNVIVMYGMEKARV